VALIILAPWTSPRDCAIRNEPSWIMRAKQPLGGSIRVLQVII
jgi:hypothetical protein